MRELNVTASNARNGLVFLEVDFEGVKFFHGMVEEDDLAPAVSTVLLALRPMVQSAIEEAIEERPAT